MAASLKRLPNQTKLFWFDRTAGFFRVEIASHKSASIALAPCPLDTRGFITAVAKVDNVIYRASLGVYLSPVQGFPRI